MNRSSNRFTPPKWSEVLVPLLLGLLLAGLVGTLVLIALSLLGVFPAG